MIDPCVQQISEQPGQPSWLEIAAGLIVMVAISFGLSAQIPRPGLDPAIQRLVFTGWSAVAGFAVFGIVCLACRPLLSTLGKWPNADHNGDGPASSKLTPAAPR